MVKKVEEEEISKFNQPNLSSNFTINNTKTVITVLRQSSKTIICKPNNQSLKKRQ